MVPMPHLEDHGESSSTGLGTPSYNMHDDGDEEDDHDEEDDDDEECIGHSLLLAHIIVVVGIFPFMHNSSIISAAQELIVQAEAESAKDEDISDDDIPALKLEEDIPPKHVPAEKEICKKHNIKDLGNDHAAITTLKLKLKTSHCKAVTNHGHLLKLYKLFGVSVFLDPSVEAWTRGSAPSLSNSYMVIIQILLECLLPFSGVLDQLDDHNHIFLFSFLHAAGTPSVYNFVKRHNTCLLTTWFGASDCESSAAG
ncbi:hypothetical protein F5146DRAFT_994860 [Armillaria mellea]|nr:hypothetical protein F5146DRAFT_994860 [Armillaria mellea]